MISPKKATKMTIETANLQLIPCSIAILEAAIAGDQPLAERLGAKVPDQWTEFGTGAFQYALDRLSADQSQEGWYGYLPIHKQDQTLIGSGGYKGAPDPDGAVEIGYEIAPAYRGRGFATEMARGLMAHALQDSRVQTIVAHTLAVENPSTSVLKKCGFKKVLEINDPDDGLIWRWEFQKLL